MTTTLRIELRPHIERFGGHTERFDALLEGEVICTSRSGWNDPARALLALGYGPETLLHVQHEGRAFDPSIVPQPIGELAKWTYLDEDRRVIRKVLWRDPTKRTDLPVKCVPGVKESAAAAFGQDGAVDGSDALLDGGVHPTINEEPS